jgi:hypothetical protein
MICKICGISDKQITIIDCKFLKYSVCARCCTLAGGGYLKICDKCKFTLTRAEPQSIIKLLTAR